MHRVPILLALLLLAPASARADEITITLEPVGRGYVGPYGIGPVTWASSGGARDVSAATGTMTVYRTATRTGVGGAVLWTKTLSYGTCTDDGGATSVPCLYADLTASDTANPGSYYTEVAIEEGAVRDVAHGTLIIEGLRGP